MPIFIPHNTRKPLMNNRLHWFEKEISAPDKQGFIIKKFKKDRTPLPYREQERILRTKKKYFGKYIPETTLIQNPLLEERDYCIRQKFIEGRELREIDIHSLSAKTLVQLLDLLQCYLSFSKDHNIPIDIMGNQPNSVENIRIRRMKNFLLIYKNFLSSSNIIVSREGDIFMVDVCETQDAQNSLLKKIKNFFARPFINRTLKNIEKETQKKKMMIKNTQENLLQIL